MNFDPSPAAESLRTEVRAFLAEHFGPEVEARTHESGQLHDWGLHRAFADKGWIRATLPKEMGGEGRSAEEIAIVASEFDRIRAPYDGLGIALALAPVIHECGTDFHRETIIPELLNGESLICMGYSEPGSGSDVAACTTRAVPVDGDPKNGWRIDGQKMWTSLAELSKWVILLTRTNPDVAKHRGLTFFLVPMDTPGIEIQEVRTLGGKRTNATYFDDVRIGDEWRLGEVDGGWRVMTTALAYERGVIGGVYDCVRLLKETTDWAENSQRPDGSRVIDDPSVRERLVRTAIDTEVAQLLGLRAVWKATTGAKPGLEGSCAKLFATEAYTRATSYLLDVLGPEGALQYDVPDAPVEGFLDYCFRNATVSTVAGGTSEIQKNNIAERMLGLPRAR